MSDALRTAIVELEPEMRDLLSRAIAFPSVSGQERGVTDFLCDWAAGRGFNIDLWQADEADLAGFPEAAAKHLPLAGRPTAVISLPGAGGGKSLLFNAHTDVVPAPNPGQWTDGPWSGAFRHGKIFGRGACDTKGPLVSALWAMEAVRRVHGDRLPGKIAIELIPGEEDAVGLGTLTSVVRGHTADAVIVLEPTECQPRNASRGGCRFHIVCHGESVHGTVKWLGQDAIATAGRVLSILAKLEARWNDRSADPLFAAYPLMRPLTVDSIHGGDWQGMVADRCTIAGYMELLPGDEPATWEQRLTEELGIELARLGFNDAPLDVSFTEEYTGHRSGNDEAICRIAQRTVEELPPVVDNTPSTWQGWSAFNSGCEAGLRAKMHGTPTLVWGPGSLAQAHRVDEFVEAAQLRSAADLFAYVAVKYCSGR